MSCGTKHEEGPLVPISDSIDTGVVTRNFDAFLEATMVEENIPGISIAIVDDSLVALSRSYGVRNVHSQTPVNEETVFEFASLSKPVFALAVLKLSEKGVIDLDKPLLEYLDFRELSNDERSKLITARMVLSHSTGLPNWTDGNLEKLSFTPGEQFSYSGEGYFYLQKVLRELTGKPLQQIMEEEVFLPLEMTNSSFIWKKEFRGKTSAGHSSEGRYSRELRRSMLAVSASSLISSARDYSRFLTHILEQYKRDDPVVKRMVSPVTQVKDDGDWGRISWGLGWGIEETSEGNYIWHWGNNNEFRSLVIASLDKGIGLVYVANGASGLKPIAGIIENTIGGIHPLTRFKYVH